MSEKINHPRRFVDILDWVKKTCEPINQEDLSQHIEKYLKNGGTIEKIPMDGLHHLPTHPRWWA